MESEDYEFYKGLDFLLENKVSFVCFCILELFL